MSPSRLALAGLVLAAANAAAQAPAGPEFRVNTYTTGNQFFNSVVTDVNGNFVVVWQRPGSLAGRRFDAAGFPLGLEFTVATFGTPNNSYLDLTGDGSGGFTVVWNAGPSFDIFGRRYDATGSPLSGVFLVNSYTTTDQFYPSVASDGSGNFVAVWTSNHQGGDDPGIFGQRFDSGGNRLAAEFAVNTYTTEYTYQSSVAVEASGGFVVVWSDLAPEAVIGQRFTSSGLRIGGEFQVSAPTLGYQLFPAVAAAPGGGFVVVWNDNVENTRSRISARRFDSSGSALGAQFLVHALTTTTYGASVAIDAAGRFVVMWTDYDADDVGAGVKARWFEADGTPRGGVFQVNDSTTSSQQAAAVASDPSGRLVATWASRHEGLGLYGVFGQRFGLLGASALAVDTATSSGSDGNGVLEPGEIVDLRPSWTNNTGVSIDLLGALTSLAGPPGATYTIVIGSGSYGTVPAGATQACMDCYRIGVSAPANRPSFHWDANAREFLSLDQIHTPWLLHVGDSFADVPRANPFYRFIETLLHHGVTAGCAAGSYCPLAATAREQMAVFVLIAKEGPAEPSPCLQPMFLDVPTSSPFCPWIAELARRGVTGGCGNGNYCPTAAVSREQMAVFVLRTLDPALNPPACTTPVFNDVPASSPFCRWIEELARRGIISGCGGGNYCPTAAVTREQMSVFLTGTFGLTLYGP